MTNDFRVPAYADVEHIGRENIGRTIVDEVIDEFRRRINVPQNYQITLGVIVWWVNGYPYPNSESANKVADRVERIYGDRAEIEQTIETPEALAQAIQQRVLDRVERADEHRRFVQGCTGRHDR